MENKNILSENYKKLCVLLMLFVYMDMINFRSIKSNGIVWYNDVSNINMLNINLQMWTEIVATSIAVVGTYYLTKKADTNVLNIEKQNYNKQIEKKNRIINEIVIIKEKLEQIKYESKKFYDLSLVNFSLYSDAYTPDVNMSIQVININSEECNLDEPYRLMSQVNKLNKLIGRANEQGSIVLSRHLIRKERFIVIHKFNNWDIFILNPEYAEYMAGVLIKNKVNKSSHNKICEAIKEILDLYLNDNDKINEKNVIKEQLIIMRNELHALEDMGILRLDFFLPDFEMIINTIEKCEHYGFQRVYFSSYFAIESFLVNVDELRDFDKKLRLHTNELSSQACKLELELSSL